MTDSNHDGAEEEPPVADEHTPTYVATKKYPNLFTVFCSCGRSSFGSSLRDSAEASFARHLEDPTGDHFRDQAATARLIGLTGLSGEASV